MKINNYENIKTNFINENPKATNNQSLRPIYENHHLKPYFYNNRINQNNINANPSSINERVAQQLSNQNNNNNIPKILINQIDLTKASKEKEKIMKNKDNECINNLNINNHHKRHHHTLSLTINILNYKNKNNTKQKNISLVILMMYKKKKN